MLTDGTRRGGVGADQDGPRISRASTTNHNQTPGLPQQRGRALSFDPPHPSALFFAGHSSALCVSVRTQLFCNPYSIDNESIAIRLGCGNFELYQPLLPFQAFPLQPIAD